MAVPSQPLERGTSPEPRGIRSRIFALGAASLVPAAIDASRALGQGNPLDASSMALTTVEVVVLLTTLSGVFDLAMKRRMTAARCFLLAAGVAIAVAVAETSAAAAIARTLDLSLVPTPHRSAAVVLRMGVASGVAGLGLFAMAVALPFAVSGAQEAERLRSAAELARLRANLQPHFLFNTLSTISGLVDEEPREARRLIGSLADLLRDSLVEVDDMRTLADEIAWLRHYAAILETRHRGSISFRWDIDEATCGVRVPRLILQPLVENAVLHGALRRREGGEVAIRTTLSPDPRGRVTCIVEDNGPGPPPGGLRAGAMGLGLVSRRLALRYGSGAEFRLESDGVRTRSIVALPAETSS
jgi:signal transduction histidine kinase